MPQFSQAISKLKASSTVVFNTRAQEMKRQGIDVVAMTAGEPDFQPPDHVLEAARDAVDQGLTKYTPAEGTFELREAVCGKFARENNLEYTPEQIIVGTGGKQILYNGFMAVLNPGDEVIIIAPYWVTYPAQIELAGGVPVPVSAPPETGFIPDIDDIRSAITARTRAIVLNSPANPTGAVYPPEVVISIAELVNEHDLWLFADDLYEHLIYDGKFTAAASYARERTLIIHGASKSYALTGWRIGYGAGPIDLIKAMNRLQGQSTSGANSIAQYAVTVALNEFDKTRAFIDMTLEAYRERRNLLVSGLNRMGLKTPNPRGAFYVMSDLTLIDPNENKAALRLLEDAHVGVVPGTDFLAPGHARFSYATSLDNVTEALERISRLLN